MIAKFVVALSKPSTRRVAVTWETVDGTAAAGRDYLPAGGVLEFAPGETEQSIEVAVLDSARKETSFSVVLEDHPNIKKAVGVCNISGIKRGPLVNGGLVVNAYNSIEGRGGYFHHNAGTSEGQTVAIEAAFQAVAAMGPDASYYRELGEKMMNASVNSYSMIRQPLPTSRDTIVLIHWLFAAKGDVPTETADYAFPVVRKGNKLIVPRSDIFRVWQIYPASSQLLYESPYSPAFDIENPGAETQIVLKDSDWQTKRDTTEITIPAGAPPLDQWKVVIGYPSGGSIPQGEGYEAYPFATPIAPHYSACAPDTFRWFDLAVNLATEYTPKDWTMLRDAVRKSAVRGQAISDLREVFKPLLGFPVFPSGGNEPTGMFCYTDHPAGQTSEKGVGANFWSRNATGNIVAQVPSSPAVSQVQIGRGFNDTWRKTTSYQVADSHLWIRANFAIQGRAFAFISGTKNYDPTARYYADLTSLQNWGAGMKDYFIPRSAFVRKDSDGAVMPAGFSIENFGLSVEESEPYTIELSHMRMVASASEEGKRGAKMPYFPGSMPFAINADTKNQQFVGWNGSPFHGYQLADYWLWLEREANEVHAGLTVQDLPVIVNGSVAYPIKPSTTGYQKPKSALLCEQQLLFLKHAQEQYMRDGGEEGPFAHTFVMNTAARSTIGNPEPHTWVYTNDDPNTRWAGYQVRVVDSLCSLVWMARSKPGWQDARDLSAIMALYWLRWLDKAWPTSAKGMPTDFPDPRVSLPVRLYEEPHSPALILRACMRLRLADRWDNGLADRLMVRCWEYLESLWVSEGELRYTWSPNPSSGEWFGFWHFEIINTLALLLTEGASVRPAAIPADKVRQRLRLTQQWLKEVGVK